MTNDPFRKAAILISSLDASSADALLEEMEPEQAARVRNAVMELGSLTEEEQQSVMREFLGRDAASPGELDGGVELDVSFAAQPPSSDDPASPPSPLPTAPARFHRLNEADIDSLGELLAGEHPQTTAVVLAHLSPERAAAVVTRLPAELQTDVLLRVARMENADPEVIRDIEDAMQMLLASQRPGSAFSPAGLATVAAILDASPDLRRGKLVSQMGNRDRRLAAHTQGSPDARDWQADPYTTDEAASSQRDTPLENASAMPLQDATGRHRPTATDLAQQRLTFAMLEALDDAALAAVIHAADSQTSLLALAGASHVFVQRILRGMPNRESRQLERRMQQLGPLRLVDVERAQATLAELAEELIDSGNISHPTARRFAVAI